MSESRPDLGQLIESTRQDAQAQQAKIDARVQQTAPAPRAKQMLTLLLLAVFALVLFYQAPRFAAPYAWPDPATHSGAAEADLIEVVTLIETYRVSQGRYPTVLSQITWPPGLAADIEQSAPAYNLGPSGYTLEWTRPHWRTRYDSQTQKVQAEALAKPVR